VPKPQEDRPSDLIRSLVRNIPPGRASTYGTIGRAAVALGRPVGGARTVAWVLAALRGDEEVPWYRVVGAGGQVLLKDRRGAIQKSRLKAEGVRFVRGAIPALYLINEVDLLRGRRRRRAL
jgi:methylated-DNA-protein-cysteine methyltransferase-like protein